MAIALIINLDVYMLLTSNFQLLSIYIKLSHIAGPSRLNKRPVVSTICLKQYQVKLSASL
jgi:hypothetical protein